MNSSSIHKYFLFYFQLQDHDAVFGKTVQIRDPHLKTIANKIEKLYERASDYIQLDKFPEEGYITLQRPGPEEVC